MTGFDAHANFAFSTVATAPSPATSGTSLTVASGDGSKFPAAPFNVVLCPANTAPSTLNAEVARCTNVSSDVLTIVRAQEGSSAIAVTVGMQVFNAATKKVFTDIENAMAPLAQAGTQDPLPPGPVASAGTGTAAMRWDAIIPAPPAGPSQFSFESGLWYAVPQFASGYGLNAYAIAQNRCLFLEWIVGNAGTIAQVGVGVWGGGAGSLIRLGLYSDLDGAPHTLVGDYGTIDTSTGSTEPAATVSSGGAVTAGRYWIAVCAQGAAASLFGTLEATAPAGTASLDNALRGFSGAYYIDGISGALPGTATGLATLGQTSLPCLGVLAA